MEKKKFNAEINKAFIEKNFRQKALPSLEQFVKIDNLSRNYSPDPQTNIKTLLKAANHIKDWVQKLQIKGLKSQIIMHEGYTPIIFTEITGDIPDKTIFLYGHFDKQPHMTGWTVGGPTTPVIVDDKLYGRGAADDGYSTYSSMLAIKSVQEQNIPLPRCVMITQGDEQSGDHIDHYIVALKQKIGNPQVIFCLDSGTLDYEHFWLTNSLRGFLGGVLTVQTLTEGVHSGDSSGIVPSTFRVFNQVINRLQNYETGQINKKFHVDVPPNRYEQVVNVVNALGPNSIKQYPFLQNCSKVSDNMFELIMNRQWRPQLTITGISNLPPVQTAGNVMIPQLKFKVSLRIPPTLDNKKAIEDLKNLLTQNAPYGAKVTFDDLNSGGGFNAPAYSQWLQKAIRQASNQYTGKNEKAYGEGGSIPLMGLLNKLWPEAKFLITGVLGPNSNAHAADQFMHIPYTIKLTQIMAHIIAKAGESHQ